MKLWEIHCRFQQIMKGVGEEGAADQPPRQGGEGGEGPQEKGDLADAGGGDEGVGGG